MVDEQKQRAGSSKRHVKKRRVKVARKADVIDNAAEGVDELEGDEADEMDVAVHAGANAQTAASLEERLAAFGEAFWSSIEEQPVQPPRIVSAPAEGEPEGLGPSRRRRPKGRRKKASADSTTCRVPPDGGASTSAPTSDPSVPAPRAGGGPSRPAPAANIATNEAALSGCSSGPLRMTAADRRRFMSGKVSQIRSKPPHLQTSRRSERGDPEEDAEFKRTLREVLDFVTPQLGKRERRQYEEAKIRALGGTLEKRPKTPYNILQAQRKRSEAYRQRALAEEKTLGVSMSVSGYRGAWAVDKALKKRKEIAKEKKRRQEEGGVLRLGMGAKEKGGLAVIPRSAVYKAQQAGKR